MDLKKWGALTLVVVLGVLSAGWFLLISPKRSEASDLHTQAVETDRTNAQLRTQLATLKAQSERLPEQLAKIDAVAVKIPADAAQPALLRSLADAADAKKVELLSVVPSPIAPVTAAAATAGSATAGSATAGSATVGTATAGAAGSTPAAGGLQVMSLSLSVAGDYYQIEDYLAALEELPRSFRVTSVTLAPGANPVKLGVTASLEDGRSLIATITGSVYAAADTAAATPAPSTPTPAK